MGYQRNTLLILEKIRKILDQYKIAITVRQMFYQLVAIKFMENNKKTYKKFCRLTTQARRGGYISPEAITDRTRQVYSVSTWRDLPDFLNTVKVAYVKDLWEVQSYYVEVWLEKEALGSVVELITKKYRVNLCITKGRPSFSYMYEAYKRLSNVNKPIVILYFGDFDPTGEAIFDNLVADFNGMNDVPGSSVTLKVDSIADIRKIALSYEQAMKYPQTFTKEKDPNTPAFIAKYGNLAVELDAIPPVELAELVENSIISLMDKKKLVHEQKTEKAEQKKLEKLISGLGNK